MGRMTVCQVEHVPKVLAPCTAENEPDLPETWPLSVSSYRPVMSYIGGT